MERSRAQENEAERVLVHWHPWSLPHTAILQRHAPKPIPNFEVKSRQARLVLRRGTTVESRVLYVAASVRGSMLRQDVSTAVTAQAQAALSAVHLCLYACEDTLSRLVRVLSASQTYLEFTLMNCGQLLQSEAPVLAL